MILGLQCVSIPTQGYDKGGSEMDFGMFELGDRRFSEKSPRTFFGWGKPGGGFEGSTGTGRNIGSLITVCL